MPDLKIVRFLAKKLFNIKILHRLSVFIRQTLWDRRWEIFSLIYACKEWITTGRIPIFPVLKTLVKEVGSGLNDNRPRLTKLLNDIELTHIIVEHKDRLTRFGFNYIKNWMDSRQCKLIVINEVETDKEDLMQDFVSLVASFVARLYGLRRSKRKTEELIKKLSNEDHSIK